jgi:hypothetical protein
MGRIRRSRWPGKCNIKRERPKLGRKLMNRRSQKRAGRRRLAIKAGVGNTSPLSSVSGNFSNKLSEM